MTSLLPVLKPRFLDANGQPLAGGKLYSYLAGTTTPHNTFTDSSGGTPNANPTILDANGQADIWIDTSAYKFVLKDASDVTLWTKDNVSFVNDGAISTAKLASGVLSADVAGRAKMADGYVNTAKLLDASVTSAKLADGAVIASKIPDASLEPVKLAADFDHSAAPNMIEVVVKNSGDYDKGNGIHVIPQLQWTTPTLLSNPSTLPTGAATMSAWSPNGEFLAVGHANAPRLTIYRRRTSTFTKLTDAGGFVVFTTAPTTDVTGLAWSPNGELLGVTHGASPYFTLYKKSGDTFIPLPNAAISAVGAINGASFSPNGQFLAFATSVAAQYLVIERIYKVPTTWAGLPSLGLSTSNTYTDAAVNTAFSTPFLSSLNADLTLLTKLMKENDTLGVTDDLVGGTGSISAQPAGAAAATAWSPNGQFLAVAHATTPFVTIYQRSGFAFTKLTDPATLPAGAGQGVAFSPNGQFLAVTHATSPFVTIYSISGTTFTKLSDPVTLPAAAGNQPCWSPNARYLVVPHASSPYFTIYDRANGSTFTKISDPSSLLAATATSAKFSPNCEFLALTQSSSPYISIYQTAATYPTNAALYVKEVPRV